MCYMLGLVTGTWDLSVNKILVELPFLREEEKDITGHGGKLSSSPCWEKHQMLIGTKSKLGRVHGSCHMQPLSSLVLLSISGSSSSFGGSPTFIPHSQFQCVLC